MAKLVKDMTKKEYAAWQKKRAAQKARQAGAKPAITRKTVGGKPVKGMSEKEYKAKTTKKVKHKAPPPKKNTPTPVAEQPKKGTTTKAKPKAKSKPIPKKKATSKKATPRKAAPKAAPKKAAPKAAPKTYQNLTPTQQRMKEQGVLDEKTGNYKKSKPKKTTPTKNTPKKPKTQSKSSKASRFGKIAKGIARVGGVGGGLAAIGALATDPNVRRRAKTIRKKARTARQRRRESINKRLGAPKPKRRTASKPKPSAEYLRDKREVQKNLTKKPTKRPPTVTASSYTRKESAKKVQKNLKGSVKFRNTPVKPRATKKDTFVSSIRKAINSSKDTTPKKPTPVRKPKVTTKKYKAPASDIIKKRKSGYHTYKGASAKSFRQAYNDSKGRTTPFPWNGKLYASKGSKAESKLKKK